MNSASNPDSVWIRQSGRARNGVLIGHRSKAEITRLEAEFAHMEAERESILLELKASKREVSSLHA